MQRASRGSCRTKAGSERIGSAQIQYKTSTSVIAHLIECTGRRQREQQAKLKTLAIQHTGKEQLTTESTSQIRTDSIDTRNHGLTESTVPDLLSPDPTEMCSFVDEYGSPAAPMDVHQSAFEGSDLSFRTVIANSYHPPSSMLSFDNTSLASTSSCSAFDQLFANTSFDSLAYLKDYQTTHCSFTDDNVLEVPELDVLRASHAIGTRLQCVDRLLNPNSASIFISNDGTFTWHHLPANLQPTAAQLTLPHHPLLDILPWPKVRSKLIAMFSLPSSSRPVVESIRHTTRQEGSGSTELTPFQLVCDLEDGGVKIWGSDPSSEESWEVQQSFVDIWWWALDPDILRNANNRRRSRGESRIRLRGLHE